MSTTYKQLNNIPESIFRAYDIRGIVGEALTVDSLFTLGLAIGSEAVERGETSLLLAWDGRNSSPEFSRALCEGLLQSGCDVIRIGMVPTPVLYFATHTLDTQSGIMLTGSHNPANYNGLKIVLKGQRLPPDEIKALHQRIIDKQFSSGQGQATDCEIISHYINAIDNHIELKKPLKVVLDCGNGIGGKVAPFLFKRLGCHVIPLLCEVDGRFPHHHPDPSVADNLQDLINVVRKENADIGLAFDGDADRLGVVSNNGEIIWPDRQLMLFSQDILKRHSGADIVFDVKCSKHLPTVIREAGGRPSMWKTGHSLIRNRMLELQAPLAGEMSGHLFFKERWFGFDDGLYAGARLLEIISRSQEDAHTLFKKLPSSVNTPELKVAVSDNAKFDIIKHLTDTIDFKDAEINTLDGLRVTFPIGWGLIRASNTTACLTLRFEADTQKDLASIQALFRAHIHQHFPALKLPF